MRRTIILQSGFGLSYNYWDNMISYFIKEGYSVSSISQDNITLIKKHNSSEYIGIGHSIGFLKLNNSNINFKYLIGLNAFNNFLGKSQELRQKRKRELIIFKKVFDKNYQKTLNDFYKKCGINNYKTDDSFVQNEEDFIFLENNFGLQSPQKTLIVNSFNDIVLPYFITKDNFNTLDVTLNLFENGKHALGHLYAEEIIKIIFDFIK